jgi:hypothetical protein
MELTGILSFLLTRPESCRIAAQPSCISTKKGWVTNKHHSFIHVSKRLQSQARGIGIRPQTGEQISHITLCGRSSILPFPGFWLYALFLWTESFYVSSYSILILSAQPIPSVKNAFCNDDIIHSTLSVIRLEYKQ